MNENAIPLQIEPEFTPTSDTTSITAPGWAVMNNVRVFNGGPQKIGGWLADTLFPAYPSGVARLLYGQKIGNSKHLIVGTHTRLYDYTGSTTTNITPLDTPVALANNPIATHFNTLGPTPFDMTSGSNYVSVFYTAHPYSVGDTITISNVTADVRGVPMAELNTSHYIAAVDANHMYFYVTTNATSTGNGGNLSIKLASGLIVVTDVAHGMAAGDRIALAALTAVGGITTGEMNVEHIIRNVATDSYKVMTAGTATSSATGGGASGTVARQIAAGYADVGYGVGYGMGYYGVGLYGTALEDPDYITDARIWSACPYGGYIICTPGGGSKLYEWDGDIANAPVAVTNAPTDCDYVFSDGDRIIVLAGNRVRGCEVGQRNTWTSTAQNEAYDKTVNGASDFISHVTIGGTHLLLTERDAYTMQAIGQPFIWKIKPADGSMGVIAQNARVVVQNKAFIAGQNDFYIWDGGSFAPIGTSAIREYVFGNMNRDQKAKCYCWYNRTYSEIWFFWPDASSSEVNRYIIYNVKTNKFTGAGQLDRTAAEGPNDLETFPRLIASDGTIYRHEYGVNDDAGGMAWELETGSLFASGNIVAISGMIPDSIQAGDISFTAYVKDFPQSDDERTAASQTVTPTTKEIRYDESILRGGVRRYRFSGSALNSDFVLGGWNEYVTKSTPRL